MLYPISCSRTILLVLGAAGGVGLTAVEIGKAMGATVIAAASSADKLAVARDHGADHGIDYSRENLRDRVKALTGGADVIYDPVGGEIFAQALRCINWEGRMLIIGFASGTIPQIAANYLLLKNIAVIGMAISSYFDRRAPEIAAAQAAIFELWKDDKVHPHIMARFALDDFSKAIALIEDRKIVGKAVLVMEGR